MNTSKFQTDVLRRLGLNNGKLTDTDFVQLTTGLIEDASAEAGDSATLGDDDTAELNLVFGSRRDLQLARIDSILEKHGVTLDDQAKETIDLMLNPGVFLHQMSQINDASGKPLVAKESKTKKKDKMKALFATPATPQVGEGESAGEPKTGKPSAGKPASKR